MRELIIDRFEETYVVCQTPDGKLDAFPRKRLPENAREGSWLVIHDDGTVEVDEEKNPPPSGNQYVPSEKHPQAPQRRLTMGDPSRWTGPPIVTILFLLLLPQKHIDIFRYTCYPINRKISIR